MGVRVENRLSLRQALLNAPDSMTKKGLRDRAMLAMLLGCGLRPVPRSPPLRDNRWRIVDRIGKHGPCSRDSDADPVEIPNPPNWRGHASECISTETIMVPRVRADNGLHRRLHPILYLFGVGHPVPTRPPCRIALRERYAPGPTRPPFEIRA